MLISIDVLSSTPLPVFLLFCQSAVAIVLLYLANMFGPIKTPKYVYHLALRKTREAERSGKQENEVGVARGRSRRAGRGGRWWQMRMKTGMECGQLQAVHYADADAPDSTWRLPRRWSRLR